MSSCTIFCTLAEGRGETSSPGVKWTKGSSCAPILHKGRSAIRMRSLRGIRGVYGLPPEHRASPHLARRAVADRLSAPQPLRQRGERLAPGDAGQRLHRHRAERPIEVDAGKDGTAGADDVVPVRE